MHKFLLCAVLAALLLGLTLRSVGLTRGKSDFAPAQTAANAAFFYTFHPDEETLIRAALAFETPLDPPLTTYGLVPLYPLKAALALTQWITGQDLAKLDPLAAKPPIYYTARFLAVLFSSLTLVLVWFWGRRLWGPTPALVALIFSAVPPLAVQQAHFYTVDGLFTLLSLATLATLHWALEKPSLARYAAVGLLVGAVGATRFSGLLLGAIVLLGHLLQQRSIRHLAQVGMAGASSVLSLVVLQPYLLTDFARLGRADSNLDLAYSLQIARGQLLRPWSLSDLHTVPYLHYWTDLWPLVAGWPLTLALAAGLLYGLGCRRLWPGLLAAWGLLYFGLIGGLSTKPVRYLLPLLPCLSLLAAAALQALARRPLPGGGRRWAQIVTGVILLHAALYGGAFASIYLEEDSRIQAGRWIEGHIPPGSTIGVEGGGFSLAGLVGEPPYAKRPLEMTALFYLKDCGLCRTRVDFLRRRTAQLDYLAITDVNRHAQFTAAADLYPAVAAFYRHLDAGQMGFERIATFKNYPRLPGYTFADDGAEPSFLGYDHPAVWIFKRGDDGVFTRAFEQLERVVEADPHCPDRGLSAAAQALRADQFDRARQMLVALKKTHPKHLLVDAVTLALERRQNPAAPPGPLALKVPEEAAFLAPGLAALSLAQLHLNSEALAVLEQGAANKSAYSNEMRQAMANSYNTVARFFFQNNQPEAAKAALQSSYGVSPSPTTLNTLAKITYQSGQVEAALSLWEQVMVLEPQRVGALCLQLGQIALEDLGQVARARTYFERAHAADSRLKDQVEAWLERLR